MLHMGDCDICGHLQHSEFHIIGSKGEERMTDDPAQQNLPLAHQEKRDVAVTDEAALAAQMAEEQAGLGTSDKAEDSFYPLIGVLQKLSPQVDEQSPAFMPGAKAGMFWLKNYEPPLASSITVQPITMYTEWVEWIPRERGGGMVRRSLVQPSNARCVDQARNKWTMPSGNDLKETRVWAVNVIRDDGAFVGFVLPCASTFNTFARQWHTAMRQKFEPNGKVSAPWRNIYKLSTRLRTNAQGTWAVPVFEHVRLVESVKELSMGFAFWKAVDAAVKKGLELTEEIQQDDDDTM